ncbi:hypothetical protein PHYBOEH_003209 [Phytophthora boehmeriae]|uniref:M96 mating-specific protein family n=1 Tax=Phytophthora boehmeriae TaxID=109152 RepID=A0A8T1WT20_9STRA|nr:hypothetical protein PHYBOEH_003209 [Phytophthora boehmeriae]
MNTFQLEDPSSSLALEEALAFVDTCELGSDEESTNRDQELDALLADVQNSDFFAPDMIMEPLKPLEPLQPPIGQFTGLMMDAEAAESDSSLENALAVLSTNSDEVISDGSPMGQNQSDTASAAKKTKKMKRARAPSPVRGASGAASAAGTAVNAVGAAGDALIKKPTKKRVRRQREELLYLRVKVKEMESSLQQLKEKETQNPAKNSPNSSPSNGQPAAGKSLLASVWESLANRQYKDRERAEQENRKLKSTLEGQIKLAKCLEKILEDQPDGDMLAAPVRPQQTKLLTMAFSSDPKGVHAELRAEIDAGFAEFDATYDPSKFKVIEKEKFDVKATSSLENGIAIQFIGYKRVPFCQEVAARGMWRFASCEAPKRQAYFYDEHETTSANTVSRTFGQKIESDNASLDYRSESMMQCRKRGDRVVIMSRGVAKPVKFSEAPVNGIRFRENGFLVIEKASSTDKSSKGKWATISSYLELRPIFDDDASDQDFTVGALTNFVIDSFHRNMHVGEDLVAGIMLEEAQKFATQPSTTPWQ